MATGQQLKVVMIDDRSGATRKRHQALSPKLRLDTWHNFVKGEDAIQEGSWSVAEKSE
jgi:hypothetical protein